MSERTPEQLEREAAAQLVARIKAGDRAAESSMVERYGRGLHRVLRRRLASESLAADLAQDTFCIAIERLRRGTIDQPEQLASFLYSTARNLLIAHQRKEWRRATITDCEAVAAFPDERWSPFREVSRMQNAQLVRRLLDELPVARDRELLERLYVRDEDKEQICRALGLDSMHFNRVLHRAKQRLRELLLRAEDRADLRLVKHGAEVGSDGTA
jgi:RNA polymerase sigma factor (sigma-70 family)